MDFEWPPGIPTQTHKTLNVTLPLRSRETFIKRNNLPRALDLGVMTMVLNELLRKLGYDEFVVGGGFGGYGQDWGLLKAEELDRVVMKRARFYEQTEYCGYPLEILTQDPKTSLARGGKKFSEEMWTQEIPKGYRVEPLSIRLDKELVMFFSVKYQHETFYVRTVVLGQNGQTLSDDFKSFEDVLKLIESVKS